MYDWRVRVPNDSLHHGRFRPHFAGRRSTCASLLLDVRSSSAEAAAVAAAAAVRRVTAVFNYGVNWQPTDRHLLAVSADVSAGGAESRGCKSR
jgi:hypothetical protein